MFWLAICKRSCVYKDTWKPECQVYAVPWSFWKPNVAMTPYNTSSIQTDLYTAEVPVPSVNISERSSVHWAGRSRLQLKSEFNKQNIINILMQNAYDLKTKRFTWVWMICKPTTTTLSHIESHLCPREEASEAEDVAAAVGHGELASCQDAQADRTPLRLLSIRPVRRALAA